MATVARKSPLLTGRNLKQTISPTRELLKHYHVYITLSCLLWDQIESSDIGQTHCGESSGQHILRMRKFSLYGEGLCLHHEHHKFHLWLHLRLWRFGNLAWPDRKPDPNHLCLPNPLKAGTCCVWRLSLHRAWGKKREREREREIERGKPRLRGSRGASGQQLLFLHSFATPRRRVIRWL